MTREEAKEFFEDPHVNYETHGYYTEEEEIEANNWAISALSADVRPNIHGHWEEDGHGHIICSACKEANVSIWKSRFCPMCGARMDEVKHDE